MNLSPQSARFLLDLLAGQQLSVGAPDFDEAVGAVLRAKSELTAIAAAVEVSEPGDATPTSGAEHLHHA